MGSWVLGFDGFLGSNGSNGSEVRTVLRFTRLFSFPSALPRQYSATSRIGLDCALSDRMIARRFEDLIVWRLSHELQQAVFAFSELDPARRDREFCDQIRASARSATHNTAEGFARYYPREFARFLRIAAGSLQETRSHLRDAFDRGYLTPEEFERLTRLTLRAFKANIRLSAYLRRCHPPDPFAIRAANEHNE